MLIMFKISKGESERKQPHTIKTHV